MASVPRREGTAQEKRAERRRIIYLVLGIGLLTLVVLAAKGLFHEPGGQVVYRPRKIDVDNEYSDRVNAALVLADIGDRQSLDAIRTLGQNATADEITRAG